MPGLRRKLRRDVGRHRAQFAAVAVMVLLGVTFFVSLYGAMANLRASIERPYEELRFADLTAAVERAPADVVGQVGRLPGVDSAIGRLNVEVPTTFPGRAADVVVGRLLSLPAPARPPVNDVLVTAGEYLRGPGEALAEKNFADHHGLRVGDDVRADFSGTEVQARIVGIVVSPEYLWPARSAPEHMPDVLRRWGVLFLAEEAMAEALGFRGSVNEVAVVLEEGADPAAVAEDVRDVLAPFGLRSIVPRDEQPSEAVLETMVGALDALSVVFPSFFLVIVALSTYVVLTRLIHAQRPQIGVLLALGFSRRAVLGHYLGFALLLGLVGSLAGLALGFVLSLPVTDLFASRVSLPVVEKALRPDVLAVGVAMSLAATAAAGLLPAYRASREGPAQMMTSGGPRARASGPRRVRPRFRGGTRWFALRQLRRNPTRTGFTILALSLAGSLLVVPFGFLDSMDAATADVARANAYDLRVLLARPVPGNASDSVAEWDGVAYAEPFLVEPTVLESSLGAFDLALYGLADHSESYRLATSAGNRVYPAPGGILLATIYERRGLRVGDGVWLGPIETRVAGFVDDASTTGFVPLDDLQEGADMVGLVNGLFLRLDPGASADAVRARLLDTLPVGSVASTADTLRDWEDMLRLYYSFIGIIIAFGATLAAAIGFNAATIGVLERQREFATMRTIGVGRRAIAQLVTTENLVQFAPSAVLAAILGTILTSYFATLFGSDLFVLETEIRPSTYVLGSLIVLGALLISQVPSLRNVARLDLARATKERVG